MYFIGREAELAKEERANLILEKIPSGVGKYSDLSSFFTRGSSNIIRILSKLTGMELIEKDSPINASSSKIAVYVGWRILLHRHR